MLPCCSPCRSPPAAAGPRRRRTPCRASRWSEAIRRSARTRSRLRPGAGARSTTPNGGAGRPCWRSSCRRCRAGSRRDQVLPRRSSIRPIRPTPPARWWWDGRRATYEIFSLRKFAELSRTRAEVASAEAGELEQRFQAALETESSYYDVLVDQELSRVARERVSPGPRGAGRRPGAGGVGRRGSDRLAAARARAGPVRGGAAAPGETRCAPRSSSWGAGSGRGGPVDAAPLDTAPAPDLPLALPEAIRVRARPGAAVPRGPRQRALGRRGAQASAATTCRPWRSAACTSATTPRSSPARPTSAR